MVNHINNNEILKPKGVISDFSLIQLSTASTNTKAMPDRTIRPSQFFVSCISFIKFIFRVIGANSNLVL